MLINQAKKEPIMIERHEKEAAVLAMRDPEPSIPWEKVKKELGLK